jgi:hypothetical protein
MGPLAQFFTLTLVQMQQLIAWHNIQASRLARRLRND